MAQESLCDYGRAKQKAAARLGLPSSVELPDNREIEQALQDYRAIFPSDTTAINPLKDHYQAALNAMQLLADFHPRLSGLLAEGLADQHSPVEIHLFSDSAEAVLMVLMDQGIPYRMFSKRYRWSHREAEVAVAAFMAGEVEIYLILFDGGGLRQLPLSPVAGRAMKRLSRIEVESLLGA